VSGNTETAGPAATVANAPLRALASESHLSRPPSFLLDPKTLDEYFSALQNAALAFARDEEFTTKHLDGSYSRERLSTLLKKGLDFEEAAASLFGDRRCCQKVNRAYLGS